MSEFDLRIMKSASAALKKHSTAFEAYGYRFFSFWCRVADENAFNLKRHHHSFFELHCCLKGETEILTDDGTVVLKEKEVLLLPPNVPHRIVRVSPDYVRFIWGVEIRELKTKGLKTVYRRLEDGEEQTLNGLLLHAAKGGANAPAKIASLLACLFFSFSESAGASVAIGTQQTDFFSLVDRYVRDNLVEIDGVGEVAAQFYMSDRQLSRICEEKTGVSFGKYLKRLKMERAKELLREYSVKETAEKLGYSDEFSFSRAFWKVVGETPAKLRKKN